MREIEVDAYFVLYLSQQSGKIVIVLTFNIYCTNGLDTIHS